MIRNATVPLPAELTGLLNDLVRRLDGLATHEPLVALKALTDLRYVIAWSGQDAAYELDALDMPLKDVAAALDTSETAARAYLDDCGFVDDRPVLRSLVVQDACPAL
ncbi:hypothetical protein K7B10_23370 [Streptomyces flavotricini]|uniref:Uncharacterized protein n=1 Tax=Streptomyces flavotricini TaxID=66888 RepID=A0ABS8E9L6_9ACTN|nr:hypothetical protein [Streptomyces flavotricini]MCC0097667.1 hypothetical protein [Streptomyces flavotricini]